MKILSVNIINFGTLSSVRFDFTDGLNTICRENGFGKSTLQGFIKAMFYGFFDTKKQSLAENDRKKYLPWGGGTCGGSLTFTIGNERYRIERTFGARPSEDTLAIWDEKTNRPCEKFGKVPGEDLFALDAEGFLRTLSLSERTFEGGRNESISERLSSLVGSGGELIGCDEAVALIDKQVKVLSKRGGRGELVTLSEEIAKKQNELLILREREREMRILSGEVREIEAQIETLLEKERTLQKTVGGTEGVGNIYVLSGQRDALLSQITDIKRTLGEYEPTIEEIDEVQNAEARLNALSDASLDISTLRELFDGKLYPEELEMKRNIYKSLIKVEDAQEVSRFFLTYPYLYDTASVTKEDVVMYKKKERAKKFSNLGFAFGVGSIFIFFLANLISTYLYVVAGASLVLSVLFFVMRPKGILSRASKKAIVNILKSHKELTPDALLSLIERRDEMYEKQKREEVYLKTSEQLYHFLMRFGISTDDIGEGFERLNAMYSRYTLLSSKGGEKNTLAELSEKVRHFKERYRAFGASPYGALREAVYTLERLKRETDELDERIRTLSSMRDDECASHGEVTLDEVRDERKQKEAELVRKKDALMRYEEEIERLCECEAQLLELSARRTQFEHRLNVLSKTKAFLTLAQGEMKNSYLSYTQERFCRIFEEICDEGCEGVFFDSNFEISYTEHGLTRPIEAMSRGEEDLYLLIARLALIDALYPKGVRPPIILDDPFLTFDDARTELALAYIKRIANTRQVIYLTCSQSRM